MVYPSSLVDWMKLRVCAFAVIALIVRLLLKLRRSMPAILVKEKTPQQDSEPQEKEEPAPAEALMHLRQADWPARALALAMAGHARLGSACAHSLRSVASDRDLLQAYGSGLGLKLFLYRTGTQVRPEPHV